MSALRYPELYVIGAPRCGTTYLYGALRSHPRVFMSPMKEPNHFAPEADAGARIEGSWRIRDPEAYLALFAGAPADALRGEASPTYLASEVAVARILELAPEARFIVSLRDPVEQIASQHARYGSAGYEDLSLEEALAAERRDPGGRRPPSFPSMPTFLRYLSAARFGQHLDRLFLRAPRERVLVLLLDDLARDQAATLRRVTDFLDLEPLGPAPDVDRNATRRARLGWLRALMSNERAVAAGKRLVPPPLHRAARRTVDRVDRVNREEVSRPPLPEALRDELRAELRPDLELASRLLGMDLVARWWGR